MKTTLKSWAEIVIESVNYIIISYAAECIAYDDVVYRFNDYLSPAF